MTSFVVNVPVWHIYYIEAETKEDALELAHKEEGPPHDTLGMECVSTEVNEEALKGDSEYKADN